MSNTGRGGSAVAQKSLRVSDGTKLSYLEAGSGKPLVLIPGWSQTAEQFKFQLEGLSDTYRVIAVDMRGHGDSDKPAHGYRMHRLARDVQEVLTALDRDDVTILGHSMGCSVLWCHFELFGPERIAKYVFCDPAWTELEKESAGAIFTPESVAATHAALCGPDGVAATNSFIGTMVTKTMPAEQLRWMIECNLKMPRKLAADLVYHHCHTDWRDVIPRIQVPSLFIGGRASLVPWQSVAWQSAQVKGSRLVIFEENEGGAHFMFVENPTRFNSVLASFMG